jgi:hypothetical protein
MHWRQQFEKIFLLCQYLITNTAITPLYLIYYMVIVLITFAALANDEGKNA